MRSGERESLRKASREINCSLCRTWSLQYYAYFILFFILFFLFFTLLKTYCRMKIMRRNCRQSGAKNEQEGAGGGNSLLRQHNFNNNVKSKSKVFLAPKIMHCWAGCAPQTGDRMRPESCLCLCLAALKRHLLSAKRYKLPKHKHKMLHAPHAAT